MPPQFHRIIAAQFLSALADNALLLVAIALLQRTGQPAWWLPLLKFCFIVAYVVLAPVIGAWADAVPKARLMAWMNALKLLGALLLAAGVHPLAAFAVIGIGAAAYAPAKYGLITELVAPQRLVAANAWIEVSVVGAVLLGTAGGGYLVSDAFGRSAWALLIHEAAPGWRLPLAGLGPALLVVWSAYAAAGLINLGIRGSHAPRRHASVHPACLLREFWRDNLALWRDRAGGRLSLAVTALFWGASAVMQFAVLRFATERIGLSLAAAALLQAVVAAGLIAGAGFAGRHVALADAPRVQHAGVALGLLVAIGPWFTDVAAAAVLLLAVGVAGGVLMVPMNALLQHSGCRLLTPGRSIAVQGFNENASVLLMLAFYAGTVRWEVPIGSLMVGLGLGVAVLMAGFGWRYRRSLGLQRTGGSAQMAEGRSSSGLSG